MNAKTVVSTQSTMGKYSVISIFRNEPCEELLKAYSDRLDLKASIEVWKKAIVQQTEFHAKKTAALLELPEIAEVPEIESEDEEEIVPETTKNDAAQSEEAAPDTTEEIASEATKENSPVESEDVETEAREENAPDSSEEQKDNDEETMEVDDQKLKEEEEEKLKLIEKKKKYKEEKAKARLEALKKREQDLKKREQVKNTVEKLAASLEKAKESLAGEEQKLENLITNYGHRLAYFQDEVNDVDALRCFQDELNEGSKKPKAEVEIEKDPAEGEIEADNVDQGETELADSDDDEQVGEPMEEDEAEKVQEPADLEGTETSPKDVEEKVCFSCGAACAGEKFCNECGANQETKQEAKQEGNDVISDTPVWITILLTKPLDKFYASTRKNLICEKEILKKASLIFLKYNPKHKTKIVLKNVSYPGAEEHLKLLNEVMKGPWKSKRTSASKLLEDRSPYTLEKIVHFLAKTHQRQEILDNMIDSCTLCERTIKRMYMEKHVAQFCLKRLEPCKYCEKEKVFEKLEEHQQTECPKFPVDCPLKCLEKHARSSIEEHLKICMNAIVQCEFYSLGCKADLKRKEVPKHMKSGAIEHVKLLKVQLMFVSGYLAEKIQK
eukprot:TRINITY_DN2964_c0_g1_i1.p1 TRINITY_DN2964_c0_g1~~TRINITY_DN2964_c0_g1_i1.p1  ORF type:complete len:612 (-),score=165.93 TRINITY_DN2964_c0_g1_i1:176-2011(-)